MPRPTAVSKANHAVTTPSSSAGGSVVRNPDGSVCSSVALSRSATPAGFSTVVMFQVKDTRSRQKLSVAKWLAALLDVTSRQRTLERRQPSIGASLG